MTSHKEVFLYLTHPFWVKVGDAGLQISSLTIRISSCLNLIIDFGPIRIQTTRLYRRSRFWSKFNLLSIKRLKYSIERSKNLIYFKKVDLYQKSWLISTFFIIIDLFFSLLISFDWLWSFGYSLDMIKLILSQRFGFGWQIGIKKVD